MRNTPHAPFASSLRPALFSLLILALTPCFSKLAEAQYKVGETLQSAPAASAKPGGFREINFDALMPADWDPMAVFKGIDLGKLQDGDPRANQLMDKVRAAWDSAPVEPKLNGQSVRIAGFVVPLDSGKDGLKEFLLVPYFGACIHTPPPPSNQIIHVVFDKPLKNVQMMATLWVSGRMETVSTDSPFGKAGYRLTAQQTAPYVRAGK
ncbi:DUF3299 domain-containing protein [Uliginosibacterium sp. H1]|uniref:DUF3299 domain-containing protein n=1 Tax=Uliginosibacterium sp. H1 TaxID=3114757 RepID=UPI002E18F581|nr:DUF3299 domain-containing protein [Uliginosibacterium sp. H1]